MDEKTRHLLLENRNLIPYLNKLLEKEREPTKRLHIITTTFIEPTASQPVGCNKLWIKYAKLGRGERLTPLTKTYTKSYIGNSEYDGMSEISFRKS
jgi:hypothetical protein